MEDDTIDMGYLVTLPLRWRILLDGSLANPRHRQLDVPLHAVAAQVEFESKR